LSDAASLGVAVIARRIARKPADPLRTFGYRRAEVIGALIQLTALFVTSLYLAFEAIIRFFEERAVEGWIVILVASGALVIDLASAVVTRIHGGASVNMRAAVLHKVADALASVVVIIAGILIHLFDWYVVDLLGSLGLSIWILVASASHIRSPIRTLMQGVPLDFDLERLVARAAEIPGVREIHHVHVWEIDEDRPMLEAHVVVADGAELAWDEIKSRVRELLGTEFSIRHSTLELESESEAARDGHDAGIDHP